MRVSCYILLSLSVLLISPSFQPAFAQLGFDMRIDKPEPYDQRVLRAEKTKNEPLKAHKKFFQNLTTHYNYYFNATIRINEVIDRAKMAFKDDYTTLLPFYNYTLDATAGDSTQLDSVIYKAQTGIVTHDLRNDWIDNLYMLWGAAWFFEKKFDSAALMFQFINYAFAEKEPDGYYKYIGSRLDGNNALSISTEEKKGFPGNMVTPPSRNTAFIWQARTLIEVGNLAEAGSLIATLQNDPFFPKRLHDDLEEVLAYWYYKQKVWDSAAVHLSNALGNAKTKQERARWEYLIAQMYERSEKPESAKKFYAKAISHTTDPVMEVYARLNTVRVTKDTSSNYIDKNISELLKMAKRDKYVDYRDVIYTMAAQMEIDRGNLSAAQDLLLKASKYNNGNLTSKSKSYLQIADLSYDQKKYLQAASFYDSINTRDVIGTGLERVQQRKDILSRIRDYTAIVARQDSLQQIAFLPEDERKEYIEKLAKRLRKEQGLSDAPLTSGNNLPNNTPVDLFQSSQSRGEWYFYNNTLKTQGAAQFKQTWGNRPNVDNWRRFASVNQQLLAKVPNNPNTPKTDIISDKVVDNTPSYENLLKNLPLTTGQLQASNDSVSNALFNLGLTYLNEIEDYPSAIETFEKIRNRFPVHNNMPEILFNLHYAYKKSGDEQNASKIKNQLISRFPASRYAEILTTGKDPLANNQSSESTKAYENIYNLFLEGKFEEAIAAKKQADSIYNTTNWQPQLLYIEAVYNIRQRNDSVAKNILQTLIGQDPNSPMAAKAQNMIDVLNRRAEIEDELSRYQMRNQPVDTTSAQVITNPVVNNPVVQTPPPVKKDTVTTQPKVVTIPPVNKDSVVKKPNSIYSFNPSAKHYAVIVLTKVDPLYVNEVKNAYFRFNRERIGKAFQMNIVSLDAGRNLLLIGDFPNVNDAVTYVQSAKAAAPSEVIPWLKADKYLFSIITDANLPVLLEKKDLEQYRKFLDQNLPGKF